MFTIKVIRADFEGWWLFEEWPEKVITSIQFDEFEHMQSHYRSIIHQYKKEFHEYKVGKYNIHTFYNYCELEYCEDCEEDMQIFYSVLLLKDEEILLNPLYYRN